MVHFCVVVWVLLSVFSNFCIASFFAIFSINTFFSHDKTHFHKKSFALIFGLVLKVRVIGTRKWNTSFTKTFQDIWVKLKSSFCVRQKRTVL